MIVLFFRTSLIQLIGFFVGTASIQMRSCSLGIERNFEVPWHNQITAEKAVLGRHLFFDKSLPKNRNLGCVG